MNAAISFDLVAALKLSYPRGFYRACNWILAERQLVRLQESGVSADELLKAADDYAAQQKALGKVGTQFILAPDNFYGARGLPHWQGPFPLPEPEKPKSLSDRITWRPED